MGKYILPAELCRGQLAGADLAFADLRGRDLSWADLEGADLHGADLAGARLDNAWLPRANLQGAILQNVSLQGACCRWADFSQADARGADFFRAVMEYTRTDGLLTDGSTRWFRMHCPEQGAFVAYKKCADMRLVQLLIPAEARRVAATSTWGRCDSAKVLTIKSFDYRERFTEATSLQTDSFVYRVGQWVSEPRFDPDRWLESAPGIYFWLTRQEAYDY